MLEWNIKFQNSVMLGNLYIWNILKCYAVPLLPMVCSLNQGQISLWGQIDHWIYWPQIMRDFPFVIKGQMSSEGQIDLALKDMCLLIKGLLLGLFTEIMHTVFAL